jgi:hypothetical protein
MLTRIPAGPTPAFPITSFENILGIILNVVMGVGFSISLISIAFSGILYVTSSGEPKNTAKAWSGFLWGAIAGMVTLFAFVIKAAVLGLVGVSNANIVNATPGF